MVDDDDNGNDDDDELLRPIPRRPYFKRSKKKNKNQGLFRPDVSIVGLGCSSFSNFFDSSPPGEKADDDEKIRPPATLAELRRDDPVVQGWIDTILYAIREAGITLLDTAPWYGHGVSETVVGWALDELWGVSCSGGGDGDENDLATSGTAGTRRAEVAAGINKNEDDNNNEDKRCNGTRTLIRRTDITINTKVGRYEADPLHMFDFTYQTTIESARRSLQRLHVSYVDVLQLHDPEFAPSLAILLDETIPALLHCRDEIGVCRAIGLTGYPLEVQDQILHASLERFGTNVWDHALTYAHYNLHDRSLVTSPLFTKWSYYNGSCGGDGDDDGTYNCMPILSAAPLSMGLLTRAGPPAWHPAPAALKEACRAAAQLCRRSRFQPDNIDVDIAHLAIAYAVSQDERIPCTILGMKSIKQVQEMQRIVNRRAVLTSAEQGLIDRILDPTNGPFAAAAKDDGALTTPCQWDGVEQAILFWQSLDANDGDKAPFVRWQA
jgi:L-galactose dehydrogenase